MTLHRAAGDAHRAGDLRFGQVGVVARTSASRWRAGSRPGRRRPPSAPAPRWPRPRRSARRAGPWARTSPRRRGAGAPIATGSPPTGAGTTGPCRGRAAAASRRAWRRTRPGRPLRPSPRRGRAWRRADQRAVVGAVERGHRLIGVPGDGHRARRAPGHEGLGHVSGTRALLGGFTKGHVLVCLGHLSAAFAAPGRRFARCLRSGTIGRARKDRGAPLCLPDRGYALSRQP